MQPGSKYHYLTRAVRKLGAGEAYVAHYGDAFTCKPESFRGVLYDAATSRGGGWVATSTIVGNSVVYAFYKRSDYMRPNLTAYPIVKKLRGER